MFFVHFYYEGGDDRGWPAEGQQIKYVNKRVTNLIKVYFHVDTVYFFI